MFFLGKLDAALNMVSAAVLLGRFRSVHLGSRATKNRYDGDSEYLLVQHMYFSFWPTFCAIYRLQARKFIQRAISKFRCAHRSCCSVRCLSGPAPGAQHTDSDALGTAHVTVVEHT
jgi:hypothetical protein